MVEGERRNKRVELFGLCVFENKEEERGRERKEKKEVARFASGMLDEEKDERRKARGFQSN